MNTKKTKEMRIRFGALFLAFCLVLPFFWPLFESFSLARSVTDPLPTRSDWRLAQGKADPSPMRAGQATGTYFTVQDQYGRNVDNVYFNIYLNSSPSFYGKAVQGRLQLYVNGYQEIAFENTGFGAGQYQIMAATSPGDVSGFTINTNQSLSSFTFSNGTITFEPGSSNRLVLTSTTAPPPSTLSKITAKDTNQKPAAGIALLLYKEGVTNIQARLTSNANGDLVDQAGQVYDAQSLAAGTYQLKASPQNSTQEAQDTYVIDSTKVYSTLTVGVDASGKKTVTFTPSGSQNLVFPLRAELPKGTAKLTVNKTDDQGKPLAGVRFHLDGPLDSDQRASWDSQPTDENGVTTFEPLAYGEYLLTEISAPSGYVVSKKIIHVMLGEDSDVPHVGGQDVTTRLRLSSVVWNPPHVENGINTIYPNQAESLSVDSVIEVPTSGPRLEPGDFFKIQLSNNVDTYGLVRSKEQGLDIFANGGKLAEGKFDPATRTITYTFTNLVKTFHATKIKLHTVLFIDKVAVPQEVGPQKPQKTLPIFYQLAHLATSRSTANFQVFYRPYYYPSSTSGSNIGTMYSIYNPDQKTATTYIYVNPLNNSLKNARLVISGKGSVLVNDLTDVKVYQGGNQGKAMVPSWGLVPEDLTRVSDLSPQIDGNANRVTIDMKDKLATGTQAYIVKVTTGYDPASTDDLVMVARLEANFNGYWSQHYGYSYYDYDWSAAQTYMKFYEHEASATGTTFNAQVTLSNVKNYIEWTKVNESGLPLEGAEFRLVRVQEGSEQPVKATLVSNRDGRLSVSGLAPGAYKLYETKAPEGYALPKDERGQDKPLSTFTVNDQGEIQKPDPADGKIFNGRSEGRFTIHKTDDALKKENRKPLEGVVFTLTPLKEEPKGSGSWVADPSKEVLSRTTDAEGNLTFSGLALGKYRLKESSTLPGYLLKETTYLVEVEEKILDPTHPENKGVVTRLTEEQSPAARTASLRHLVEGGWIPTSTQEVDLTPLFEQTQSRLAQAEALFSKAPLAAGPQLLPPILQSTGGGKYQYQNPREVDGSRWQNNIQQVDVDQDGQADYQITQTMTTDGTTPGQYKVNVRVEQLPETMELVILMDNCSAFAQTDGTKIDRFQWAGMKSGQIQNFPTANDWLDYYFRGFRNSYNQGTQEGRVTSLLTAIQKKYPQAKVTLLGAGGAASTVQYWVTNPYTSEPIASAISKNHALTACGLFNPGAPDPKWEFTGGWGRAGLKEAMQQAYNTLNSSTAQKKAFFHLQGVPTFSINEFTAPLLPFWDENRADDARRTFAQIQKIAQVSWLVELDPSGVDDYFFERSDYLANGLPDPNQVHFLQIASKYFSIKDRYWQEVDAQAMESAYNQEIPAIAQEITGGASSDTKLDLQIRLADNVLWRDPADQTMDSAGVIYDPATKSLTKTDFQMDSNTPLSFTYYIKANAQAVGTRLNVFENINEATTSGLKITKTQANGAVSTYTSALPIPQLRIPGWESKVVKYWYGNSDADNTSFQNFPETGTSLPQPPADPLARAKRKPSQVLIHSGVSYSDDSETKIGLAQRMQAPFGELYFVKALPYYDNNGVPISYRGTEYHDPLFHTKTHLVQDENQLVQTFYIGAQMDPVVTKTDIQLAIQWGAGTTEQDQVPVTVQLQAFQIGENGAQIPISDADLQKLINGPTERTIDQSKGWKDSFKDLPTSQITNGQATELVYRVKQATLPGFDTAYLYDYQDIQQTDGSIRPTHFYTVINQKHTLLEITNTANEVDFYKEDSAGNPLAGAIFTLQRKDETQTGQEVWTAVPKYTNVGTTEVEEGTQTRQKLHLTQLAPGTYRLMETTAPEGYQKPTEPVASFTVTKEGKVESVQVRGASGAWQPGHQIINLPEGRPPIVFYLEKLGSKKGETPSRISAGTLRMKLTLDTTDEAARKSQTFEFSLAEDYQPIGATGKTGLALSIPSDWPGGDYLLTEEEAPAGYQKKDVSIRLRYEIPKDLTSAEGRRLVQVDAQGKELAVLYEETKQGANWSPVYGPDYGPLAIENYVYVLPSTAGPGTFLFTLVGTFLTVLAIRLQVGSKRAAVSAGAGRTRRRRR